MSKRITALCLAAAYFCTGITAGAAWYDDAMEKAVQNQYMNGDENGELHPEQLITRAEAASIIKRITSIYNYSTSIGFKDVAKDAWYETDVNVAVGAGLFAGVSDSDFAPDAYMTRQEAAVVLERAFAVPSATEASFTDGDEIADWAKDAVYALCGGGYISGYPDGSFKPNACVTRAEFAGILAKLATNYVAVQGNLKGKTYDGNVVISKEASLTNTEVKGNIYYTAGVGSAEVRLTSVTAENIMYGGDNGGKIGLDTVTAERVCTYGSTEKVLMLTGNCALGEIETRCETTIKLMDFTGNAPTVVVKGNTVLEGEFGEVHVKDGADLVLLAGTKVKNIVVDKNSAGSVISGEGAIEKIKTDATITIGSGIVSAGSEKNSVKLTEKKKGEITESYSGEDGRNGNVSWSAGSASGSIFTSLELADATKGDMTPSFSAGTNSYRINVGAVTEEISLKAYFSREYTCSINDDPIASGMPFELGGLVSGNNTFVIVCYKGAREAGRYTINVVRAAGMSDQQLADFDAGLASITIADLKGVGMTNLKDLLIDEYRSEFATKRSEKGSMLTQAEYQAAIDAVNSTTAKLSSIGITAKNHYTGGYDFGKSLAAGETNITVKVDSYVNSVEITPVPFNGSAQLTVNGSDARVGGYSLQNLQTGSNVCTIVSTGANGTQTYTVTVIKDVAGALTSNRYFHDGTAGYTSNVTPVFTDGYMTLDSDGETENLENSAYFDVEAGKTVTANVHARAKSGRITLTAYLVAEDGTETKLGQARITATAKSYNFTTTVSKAGKYKLHITYNGVLMIDELSAESN